jgi:hypothetical protein
VPAVHLRGNLLGNFVFLFHTIIFLDESVGFIIFNQSLVKLPFKNSFIEIHQCIGYHGKGGELLFL